MKARALLAIALAALSPAPLYMTGRGEVVPRLLDARGRREAVSVHYARNPRPWRTWRGARSKFNRNGRKA